MDNKQKIIQAIKLSQAIKQGKGEFVLLSKLDKLEERIDAIKMPDNSDIKSELQKIKNEIEQEIICEVEIV